jgi:hypothetical protein
VPLAGGSFQASRTGSMLTHHLAFFTSHPGSASAHPTPALISRAQDGITLGPEQGEPGADFTNLGFDAGTKRKFLSSDI